MHRRISTCIELVADKTGLLIAPEAAGNLCVIDQRLRTQLQQDVASVFLPRYRRFYEKYTKIKFSKKHQSEYTKYSPDKIEDMLLDMYVDPIDPL